MSPERRRECTACPPWVLRCAHWCGRLIVLTPTRLPVEEHRDPWCLRNTCEHPFHVNEAPDRRVPCATCGVPNRLLIESYTCHDNIPAAEAEFHRRELALLGREEAP